MVFESKTLKIVCVSSGKRTSFAVFVKKKKVQWIVGSFAKALISQSRMDR